MRIIKLSKEEEQDLQKLYRESSNATVRKRSQCILLSSQGKSIAELSHLFGVQRNTVSRWFSNWEREQQAGLSIGSGRGRKKKLGMLDAQLIKDYVAENGRELNTVLAKLEQEHHVQLSKKTLQRFLKTTWL
jgi:transposase